MKGPNERGREDTENIYIFNDLETPNFQTLGANHSGLPPLNL
jgi:hypothetical protein